MSKYKPLLESSTEPQLVDELLADALQHCFDAELRTEWDQKLREQHVHETKPLARFRQLSFRSGLAAVLVIGLGALLFLLVRPQPSAAELALAELEATQVYHPGLVKGKEENQQVRERAIRAFNKQAFPVARMAFDSIEDPTESDRYYAALALLLNQQYAAAAERFDRLRALQFEQEVHWYAGLAHALNNSNGQAYSYWNQIETGEWKYETAQQLIQALQQ